MNYDTIKILNLESINVDLNKSFIIKNNDKLFVSIVLLKQEINTCPNCGSINTIVKDYYNKKILFINFSVYCKFSLNLFIPLTNIV